MKYLKGYKVLALRGGLLQSVSSPGPIIYGEENPARPKRGSGPLAVFTNYEAAEDFIGNALYALPSEYLVFKCDYIRWRKRPPKWVMSWGEDYGLWVTGVGLKFTLRKPDLPPGTDLASVVILREEV